MFLQVELVEAGLSNSELDSLLLKVNMKSVQGDNTVFRVGRGMMCSGQR